MTTRPRQESRHAQTPLATATCFIETQFPVAKVSMESYKERKAVAGQTLTGLGKWWGRKPLVLVRSAILGLLMPASDDPVKDREIFLKLLTMDEDGLLRRKTKNIPTNRLIELLKTAPTGLQQRFLDAPASGRKLQLKASLSRNEKRELQDLIFGLLPYAEKIRYCDRPEQSGGPSSAVWHEINEHLATSATKLAELVHELGQRRFGERPRVGDSFCGGGSVPFEAARIGCDAYGSELNPVAALLTWAALNVVGAGEEVEEKLQRAQKAILRTVDSQVTLWGIEHNDEGWRADAYLYCVEVDDPETGWRIPLAPSWLIAENPRVVAKLVPDQKNKRYDIVVCEGASEQEVRIARESGTVVNSRLKPPNGSPSTPIETIRRNLRVWENGDIVPRSGDVFRERLYCIRWVETYTDKDGRARTRRHYRAPTEGDLEREGLVLKLLKERFQKWQANGYLPGRRIEPGKKTDEPIRTRGWTYWHHLFTPRQLLLMGLVAECLDATARATAATTLLLMFRWANWNSRLCRWLQSQSGGAGGGKDTFFNNALNPVYNFSCRGLSGLSSALVSFPPHDFEPGEVTLCDARAVGWKSHIWVTDPPYADAISYDELSEFFLAWCDRSLPRVFPNWYTDSKRALAVKGEDTSFKQSMVDCYKRLVEHMPDNGLQIVMFTHQDAAVWADLSLILWAAGLRVTAAWCIATETDSALKKGNYVQGTVLLVLRKRTEAEPVFLDEIAHKVEVEVKRQLDSMLEIEDESDPNFGDADYQLAAYAAALRVLTERPIEEIDPAREILRERPRGEVGPVEQLIRNAVRIACDHLVPRGIQRDVWKGLTAMERFYLKGLEVESHGEYRNGIYQELARGFGAADYGDLLASTKANQTRVKTASEFGRKMLSGDGFAGSLVRQVLFAVQQCVKSEETGDGLNWLRTELVDYWGYREKVVHILEFLGQLGRVGRMEHWEKDVTAASLLAGAVRNDHV